MIHNNHLRSEKSKKLCDHGPVLVEFIVEQHDMVYPMVATGADLNDMISRPVHDQFQESEM